jgi:UDP-N-acetylmuramate-alanine ligase
VFADRAAVVASFDGWLRTARRTDGFPERPVVGVLNVGDPGVAELAERLRDWTARIIATAVVDAAGSRSRDIANDLAEQYATAAGPALAIVARITTEDPDGTTIEMTGLDPSPGAVPIRLATVGRHNVANALGVAGAALAAGADPSAIVAALGTFVGVGRRLERLGEVSGVVVFDDYGHHPSAIRVTLDAIRQRVPGRRIWAVYEPLTYHRTAAMLDQFADVLATADAVAIADIWAGRDPDTTITSAAALADAVATRAQGIPVAAPGSVEATAAWLAEEVRSGDAVLVMGGGKSTQIGRLLLEALADR